MEPTKVMRKFPVLKLSNTHFTKSPSGKLLTRDKIEEKYKWNLEDIYKSQSDWEADFKWLNDNGEKYSSFRGTLGKSARNLFECFKFDEIVGIKLGKIFLYAMLLRDLDLGNTENQGRYDRVITLNTKLSTLGSFIRPEILTIPENKLRQFIDEFEKLRIYKHEIDDLLRIKEHTLTFKEEKILALASSLDNVPYNVFSLLENADMKFPTVEDSEGKKIEISHGRYTSALFSTDRTYRERVYREYYKEFIDHKNTLFALFDGNIKSKIFFAKSRNYNSTLEAALKPNNIPIDVYNNLINSVNQNLTSLHRWLSIKKKMLKLDEIHPYDTYVTLFPTVQKEYSFEEGKALVLKALEPMGEEYINNIKYAFDNRWLDVFETKSKRSGAYSSGSTYGVHPYVLLNWNNELNDVFTLAHEMGHNMHSHYTITNQPYPYSDYTIFLAEIASTTNEALLLNYLIENAGTKEEKLSFIEKYLTNIVTTFYRQTRFAEFEKVTHEISEKQEALTSDLLCELYGKMYKKYWGEEITVDDEETYTWARVPHFYYNFYVYQYATGFAASETLSLQIINEGKPAIEKYLNFLKAGSSKYSIDILKEAGVDMTSHEPVNAVTNKMNLLLNEMEKLLSD